MPSWWCMRSNARVDVVQRHAVAEHAVDVELAVHPQLHEPGHLAAALDAAEGRAGDAAAGDQEARHDLEQLALAGDADHRREPPGLARRLDRLAHDLDVAGGLEGVVAAVAARELAQRIDDAVAGEHRVRRAVVARHREALLREVDRDDLLGAAQPAARHGTEADEPAAEDGAASIRPRPEPCRRRPRGRSRGRRRRCSRPRAARRGRPSRARSRASRSPRRTSRCP